MNVLVVGGAGYIGSHAVRLLLDSGHTVWVYDNLSRGHRQAVPESMLIEGELADRGKMVATLREKKIDAVMHFAAFALVNESVNDPALYYRNNVIAALELLDAMREADVKKIVFSSTTATYGEPEIVPIAETTLQQPINCPAYPESNMNGRVKRNPTIPCPPFPRSPCHSPLITIKINMPFRRLSFAAPKNCVQISEM